MMQQQKFQIPLRSGRIHAGKPPCVFFAQGRCRNAANCSFSHDSAVEAMRPRSSVDDSGSAARDPEDSRGELPCRFYAKGNCLKGDSCPFAHILPITEAGQAVTDEALSMSGDGKEDRRDDGIRQFGGAVVQFANGAAVVKVSLQADFSAARVSFLPGSATPDTVSRQLRQLGFIVSHDEIRVRPSNDPKHCVADIRVEDPSFSRRLCSVIDDHSKELKTELKAVAINCPMPRMSGIHRVECKKVLCSWYRPFKTVWLNFGSQNIAQKVHDKYCSGRYTVLSHPVQVHAPKDSRTPVSRFGKAAPRVWTVMLTEVPAEATREDVEKCIPPTIQPNNIELGQPSFFYEGEMANALVKSKLMEIGPLEWWEDAVFGQKRAKVKARFQDDGDAAKAASLLNNGPLPFHKKGKLTVQALYSARFKVQDRIYQAVRPIIEKQTSTWLAKRVYFAAYNPSGTSACRVLKLEGDENKSVAESKRELEQILMGRVAMFNDKTIWTPAFTVNGDVFGELKELEQRLGIVIIRNKRRSRVELFGRENKCREAEELLNEVAQRDSSTSNFIKLDADQFAWACQGGFKAITEALGGKATFDIVSTPKRIVVTGSDADFRLAVGMVEAQNKVNPTSTSNLSEAASCSVCWTEPEDTVLTDCGHAYCSDCFEHLCVSTATSPTTNADVSLSCEGDSSRCRKSLSLEFLQEHLSSDTLEEVLEASFNAYIARRLETFHYCPSADCGQVYRSETGTFTCPNCLTSVCTSCHAPHQGMTCAEHKDMASGGYAALQEAKKRLGIKDCPRCKTAIEKVDGCDHMTCGGCKTHICWKCLQTFGTGNECYEHMDQVHGNIGLEGDLYEF
ncbi:hypothetical protein QBC35DRAFT_28671 [Podospora australis]|uniref:Uncharacterized protein n=1 Tax=Podospora australis TaxID=1536484 RepID=A0AAN6WRU7_9PEZI|nr:hypothetical protein QBC35DRAFT_28671 [Podospora australis]